LASSSICPAKSDVFGVWPMAMNTPSSGNSDRCPVFRFWTTIPTTSPLVPSLTSTTSESQTKSILGLAMALSCMIFDARSVSRRWTTVTLVAKRVR
jgi:hypothetical protein